MGCAQCIIHCSNVFVDKDGKYVTSALEYETIYAMTSGLTPFVRDLALTIPRLPTFPGD
jgi:aldehyde:ferredoxin oxidoreductase